MIIFYIVLCILIVVAAFLVLYLFGGLVFMAVLVIKGLKDGNIKSLRDSKFRSEFRQLLPCILFLWGPRFYGFYFATCCF